MSGAQDSGKRRRALSLAGIVTVLFLVIGAGLGFALFVGIYGLESIKQMVAPRQVTLVGMHIDDPEIGYVLNPNQSTVTTVGGRNVTIRTDAEGARIPVETSASAPPDAPPVLSVGGSQTLGWGVEQRETFSHLVAQALHRPARNFGIAGHGTVASLLQLERHLDQQSSLVLYGFFSDHLNRNIRPCKNSGAPYCTAMPFLPRTGDEPEIAFAMDPARSARLGKAFSEQNADQRGSDPRWDEARAEAEALLEKYLPEQGTAELAEHKRSSALFLFDRMMDVVDAHESHLVVIYIPDYLGTKDIEPMDAALRDALEKGGALVADMAAPFQEARDNDIPIAIEGDGHLTPEAHALIAELVTSAVLSRGWNGNDD
jgi:hypothetical protein